MTNVLTIYRVMVALEEICHKANMEDSIADLLVKMLAAHLSNWSSGFNTFSNFPGTGIQVKAMWCHNFDRVLVQRSVTQKALLLCSPDDTIIKEEPGYSIATAEPQLSKKQGRCGQQIILIVWVTRSANRKISNLSSIKNWDRIVNLFIYLLKVIFSLAPSTILS